MPSQTFMNLPPEKRAALLAIALDEFASHDYQSASISRICAQAAIAKGSLYQYFSDKLDFYQHVVAVASETLTGTIQQDLPPDGPLTLFRLLRWQMSATVRAALRHPREAQLIRRAYGAPGPQDAALASQAQSNRTAYLTPLIKQAMDRGEIAADLDPDVVLYAISSLIADLGPLISAKLGLDRRQAVDGEPDQFDSPVVEQVYDSVIRILQHGLAVAPPQNQ